MMLPETCIPGYQDQPATSQLSYRRIGTTDMVLS